MPGNLGDEVQTLYTPSSLLVLAVLPLSPVLFGSFAHFQFCEVAFTVPPSRAGPFLWLFFPFLTSSLNSRVHPSSPVGAAGVMPFAGWSTHYLLGALPGVFPPRGLQL